MLPLELLRSGQLPVAAVAAASMTFGMYGLFILFSLDFQQQRGLSAIAVGLELLPMPAVFAVASPLIGPLATRIGPKTPMATGLFLMGAGLFGYAALGGAAGLPGLEADFIVIGLGLALNTGPVVAVAVTAVPSDRVGLAGGVANLARMLGATLGVAVMGTILAGVSGGASHGPRFLSGLTAALVAGGVIEMLGALVALLKVKNPGSSSP
jgi:MFS family permease